MSYDYRDWPNIDVPKKSSSVREPSMPLGAEAQGTEVTVEQRGASLDFNNQQAPSEAPLSDGLELWSLCIKRNVHVASDISSMLDELAAEGGIAGARLKVLAELQSILRSTPAGIKPGEMVQVPSWHLVVMTRALMEKLGG